MGMDFGASARRKAKSLLAPSRPQDQSRSALRPDKLRDNIIREAEQHTPRFQTHLKRQPEVQYEVPKMVPDPNDPNQQIPDPGGATEERTYHWDTYPEAVRDAARALFGLDDPELLPGDQVKPEYRLNRDIAQMLHGDPEFRSARHHARMNEAQATYGAMALGDSLKESAEGVLKEHVARSEEIREESENLGTAQEMFDKLRQIAKQEVQDAGAVQDPTRRDIKRTLKQIDQHAQQLGNLIQQSNQSGQVVAAAQAANAAAQAAHEAVEAMGLLPGMEPGMGGHHDPAVQMEMADKWRSVPELLKIAREVGRMYNDMRFHRETRTKNAPIEPVGIKTGGIEDLSRVLPHEMAQANIPALLPLFIKNLLERKVLVYDMEGMLPSGKGPVIEVHDGSGSMQAPMEKYVYATAVALALMLIALREKRPFVGIEFGSSGQMKQWYFPANEPADPERVFDFASHFFNGGTHTATGMAEALRVLEEEPSFKTADVVLIGDGQDHFREQDLNIRKRLTEMDVRVHGITILTPNNPYFDQMTDWHTDVSELAGDQANEAAARLAREIT